MILSVILQRPSFHTEWGATFDKEELASTGEPRVFLCAFGRLRSACGVQHPKSHALGPLQHLADG